MVLHTPLYEVHKALGAEFAVHFGYELAENFQDALSEYKAVRSGVGLLDCSYQAVLEVSGPDRVMFLHGMLTNDIQKLQPGEGCYATLVTAQARLIADLRVYAFPDVIWLDCLAERKEKVLETLKKFIISEQVELRDRNADFAILSLQGPKAQELLDGILAAPLPTLQEFQHLECAIGPTQIHVIKHAHTGEGGFDLIVPKDNAKLFWEKLLDAGAQPVGMQAFNILRIEAGIPWFGVDMDEANLPMEANLEDKAISYSKGCYIGQEIIARVKTYGEVAKRLRGLILDGSEPVPMGTKIFKEDAKIGEITSSVFSPTLNKPIALGYVQRGSNEPGTLVTVKAGEKLFRAQVVSLPFYQRR